MHPLFIAAIVLSLLVVLKYANRYAVRKGWLFDAKEQSASSSSGGMLGAFMGGLADVFNPAQKRADEIQEAQEQRGIELPPAAGDNPYAGTIYLRAKEKGPDSGEA